MPHTCTYRASALYRQQLDFLKLGIGIVAQYRVPNGYFIFFKLDFDHDGKVGIFEENDI